MTPIASHIKVLAQRVDQILAYHFIDARRAEPNEIIAHFSSYRACEAMIETAERDNTKGITLWAGDARCLNDPLEGRALIKFAEDGANPTSPAHPRSVAADWPPWSHSVAHRMLGRATPKHDVEFWKKIRDVAHQLYTPPMPSATGWNEPRPLPSSHVYLVSFCNDKDSLDLWRAYGENGEGVCMVMPLRGAASLVASSAWKFYRVMYDEQSKRRAWVLLERPLLAACAALAKTDDAATARAVRKILDTVSPVLHLYKHHQFKTENEIRLIFRGGIPTVTTKTVRDQLRPVVLTEPFFLKTPGCRIVLGPRVADRNRKLASLETLLRLVFRRDTPEVHISGVPYQ